MRAIFWLNICINSFIQSKKFKNEKIKRRRRKRINNIFIKLFRNERVLLIIIKTKLHHENKRRIKRFKSSTNFHLFITNILSKKSILQSMGCNEITKYVNRKNIQRCRFFNITFKRVNKNIKKKNSRIR
jgi:hypothetical protein